ncbi:MAG: glutamine--fructose-6-phosphate transaminase (isomerizing) [Proteobacteria bacterium]|nr:glutamine--fructose-6-phosphate transaminase (isomerizing) [Pseudomonadota bacterium]
MCGIMGYVGSQTAAPILLQGLRRLEYRGYDSAGIATLRNGSIDRRRAEGKLDNLVASLEAAPLTGTIGIGHTRWATHGRPTLTNAHPHANDRVAVVHNGIIENFRELREELVTKGHCFETETDSEVIAHLICDFLNYQKTPEEALKATLASLEGAFAIAVIFAGHHHLLLGARRGSPLAVGHSEGEMFIGSDALALAPFTARVSYLEEGDWVAVTPQGARFYDAAGQAVERPATQSAASTLLVGKGPYRHFMEKEIFEQPSVVSYTLNSLLDPLAGRVVLPDLGLDWTQVSRLTLVACGTAHYAGHVAKYWFEQLARLPVEIDIASEFRYRDSPLPEGGVALFISQSGETIDTLEALRHAKAAGQRIISLVNMPESAIARESDAVLQTLAGPEIGVASTKAFTTQLTVLACLALAAARARGQMTPQAESQGVEALVSLPERMNHILKRAPELEALSRVLARARDVLYLGRGALFPIALEGALKLKEISYIHAEGYAAGEMKHGPIALIDEAVPVVIAAPSGPLFKKVMGNLQEVSARGGKVLLLSDAAGVAAAGADVEASFTLPTVPDFIAPLLYSLPVQLLAYQTALRLGTDVDRPRNLAKSVTVE